MGTIRSRLVLAIGSWRVRTEGRENAEQPHRFWDWLVGKLYREPTEGGDSADD